MEISKIVKRLGLSVHDLYMELETREEYDEFVHMPLMQFGNDEIYAEIERMEAAENVAV